jgi:hypothetical protein
MDTSIIRFGKSVPIDAVFIAWTSGDLELMLKVSDFKTNPIDRHFLLQSIVKESYKLRKDEKYRNLCYKFSELHLNEFPSLAKGLKKDMGSLPRVTTFQHFATILTEDLQYIKAIEVCQKAILFGLEDGTKGGYEGRIKKIQDKVK